MQVETDEQENTTLYDMKNSLGSEEIDISIDDVFQLISEERQRSIKVLRYQFGPLWVKISPDGKSEKNRLEIIMTQDTPALRGKDRESMVRDTQYVESTISKEFMFTITSRIYKLDLSGLPCHVFSSVHIVVEYGPSTQVPFPHGNTILLTSIGSVGQRNNWPVEISVERCFLSKAFVASLQKTVCLNSLRLWNCGVLDRIDLPELNYLRKLSLRLFHPMNHDIARIDFSKFRMLKSLWFYNDIRVVSMRPNYKDTQPGCGMLQHHAQGLDKYEIGFNEGVPHEMKRVRLHLAFEDLSKMGLKKILVFFQIDKLYLEASPPEDTVLYIPCNGDVFMASTTPLTCTEYTKRDIDITVCDDTSRFLQTYPHEFLRVKNLMTDGVPFERTHAALLCLSEIAKTSKILLVVIGRTASVLMSAVPSNPQFNLNPLFDELRTFTNNYLTSATQTAVWAFSCGPLSSPTLTPVTAPAAYGRFFVSTLDKKWTEPTLCAASETRKVFVGRVSVSRKNLLARHAQWDSEFARNEFFMLFINENFRVDIPSANGQTYVLAHADFSVPVRLDNSKKGWFSWLW